MPRKGTCPQVKLPARVLAQPCSVAQCGMLIRSLLCISFHIVGGNQRVKVHNTRAQHQCCIASLVRDGSTSLRMVYIYLPEHRSLQQLLSGLMVICL